MFVAHDTRGRGEPPHDAEREFRAAFAEFVALLMHRTLKGRNITEAAAALRSVSRAMREREAQS